MASTPTPPTSNKSLLYIVLGLLALPVLALLYYLLSFLAVNLFLGLDSAIYGRVAAGGWLGYALLGLGLGAAGGLVAAQQRYRLHRGLVAGAAALVAGLGLLAFATQASPVAAETASPAPPYQASKQRVSCGACTIITTDNTREAQNENSYEASNLLKRDSTKAWISNTAVEPTDPLQPTPQLHLTIAPLAGHQLVGLRLRNGYCKNSGVYESFSRAAACQVALPDGPPQTWTLADAQHQEVFLPLPAARRDSTALTFTITDSYLGTNHPEVALAWLVPVFEPVAR